MRRVIFRPGRRTRDDSWFYHPEMQARIAEAEAERREGRTRIFHSLEELMQHLHSLKDEG
jgi:hypothetical protein